MEGPEYLFRAVAVALLTEGVDRNSRDNLYMTGAARRPPHGGRG